jgi:serine/threonine-protein kinase RsbW
LSAHLRVDAQLERLADVRQFVRQQMIAAHAAHDSLDDMVQAVDEAATNVITHGYRGTAGWIEVDVEVSHGRCVVTMSDAAPPFDATGFPEPDLSIPPLDRIPGGMGVHLIRAATDEFDYRPRPGGGNILVMGRSLGPERTKEG